MTFTKPVPEQMQAYYKVEFKGKKRDLTNHAQCKKHTNACILHNYTPLIDDNTDVIALHMNYKILICFIQLSVEISNSVVLFISIRSLHFSIIINIINCDGG